MYHHVISTPTDGRSGDCIFAIVTHDMVTIGAEITLRNPDSRSFKQTQEKGLLDYMNRTTLPALRNLEIQRLGSEQRSSYSASFVF